MVDGVLCPYALSIAVNDVSFVLEVVRIAS